MINELIEALQIFSKYIPDDRFPTYCEHDILMVMVYDASDISREDLERLKELHFYFDSEYQCFASTWFGSA